MIALAAALAMAFCFPVTAGSDAFAVTTPEVTDYLGYEIRLFDEVRDCNDSYHAEKDDGTEGCWIGIDDGSGPFIPVLFDDGTLEVLEPSMFDLSREPDYQGGPYDDSATNAGDALL